ncbi:MAG: hypothetical protein O3A55_05060 [Bacteroidetes bacterium]|nr:hypothetical protein [Bacteroidota bacterium]
MNCSNPTKQIGFFYSQIFSFIHTLATFGHGEKFTTSKNGFSLLETKIGIIKFDTKTNSFNTTAFINSSNLSVNGIIYDEAEQLIYVSDAKDYVNAGEIHIFKNDVTKKGSYTVGIIPGAIGFVR